MGHQPTNDILCPQCRIYDVGDWIQSGRTLQLKPGVKARLREREPLTQVWAK